MLNFEFATATRIIFGGGTFKDASAYAAEMGWRALVVSGFDLERSQPLLQALAAAAVVPTLFMVNGEPTLETVRAGVTLAGEQSCDLVIGFGGGSAIDAGKAIAVLATNPGDVLDYLEVVGRGQRLQDASLPFMAIPTTAGTGAEVTRNAVIAVPEKGLKVSLRSPLMLPRLALVDAELTHSLPPTITASTGLDALTQLIEPFVSLQPNPLVDAICREGIGYSARSLKRAYQNGKDAGAREDLCLASLFGGLALANAKLGAVHGLAAVLGGKFNAPHGAVCARLLPYVYQANIHAMQQRQPENPTLRRYAEIARMLTGDPAAGLEDGAAWLNGLCNDLVIPPLRMYGVASGDFGEVIQNAAEASSMKGNPIQLTGDELRRVLEQAL
jgi:alcohol dehydrogenase class IV